MGKISKTSFDEDDDDDTEDQDHEEFEDLIAKKETNGKPAIKFRTNPSIILKSSRKPERVSSPYFELFEPIITTSCFQFERKVGVLGNNLISLKDSDAEIMKMRSRQQHSLFIDPSRQTSSSSRSPGLTTNFDVEAVKLNHERYVSN